MIFYYFQTDCGTLKLKKSLLMFYFSWMTILCSILHKKIIITMWCLYPMATPDVMYPIHLFSLLYIDNGTCSSLPHQGSCHFLHPYFTTQYIFIYNYILKNEIFPKDYFSFLNRIVHGTKFTKENLITAIYINKIRFKWDH